MELIENRSPKKDRPRDDDARAQKAVLIIREFLTQLPHS